MEPSLVCRAWHQVFAPVVWQSFHLQDNRHLIPPPPLELLARNAHLVRELEIKVHNLPPEYFSIPFTHLAKLRLVRRIHTYENVAVDFAQLVTLNRQLEDVAIRGLRSEEMSDILKSIVSVPKLRILSICGWSTTVTEFATLWRGLNNLERLTLERIHCRDGRGRSLWDGLEALPVLKVIRLDQSSMVPLLRLCPNVHRLETPHERPTSSHGFMGGHHAFMDELLAILKAGHLKRLDSLCIPQIKSVQKLALCLEAIDGLKILNVGVTTSVTRHWFELDLARHFQTLEQVSFEGNDIVSSATVQAILTSCPQLTCLKAFQLRPAHIIEGKPWVCSGLRTLRAEISLWNQDENEIRHQSHTIFGRLSKLEKLEHLNVRGNGGRRETQGLDLRLESGLGQLSTMRNLRFLDFGQTIQNMSAEDIAWMRKHWTRLKKVIGRCNGYGTFEQQPLPLTDDMVAKQ